jgi:chemotaxis response regulator CheB
VWVLGASLGGPEVVKHFLAALPGIPPVCMILGQHIGENFTEILASQLNRVTGMKVVPAKSGDRVQNGVVYVAPIEGRLMIDREGVFSIVEETRPRLYKACIDYVMEEVALRYGKNASAIIFSGMGDDGAEGCKIIARVGGEVWAQSAETCIISSMPDSARATGYVSWTGSPEALAIKLMQHTTEEVERAMMFQGTESLTRH